MQHNNIYNINSNSNNMSTAEWAEIGQTEQEKVTVTANSRATYFANPDHRFGGAREEHSKFRCQMETVQIVALDYSLAEKDNSEAVATNNSSLSAAGGGDAPGRYTVGQLGNSGVGLNKDDKGFDPTTTPAIMVSNIPPQTTEDDLWNLCGLFGKVEEVKLLKYKREETPPPGHEHKGKCFVTFADRATAERCYTQLPTSKYGLYGLILDCQWAKESERRVDRFGDRSPRSGKGSDDIRMQSYGQSLAQSTTDKDVHYITQKY
jgi:hypothetical protein